MKKRLKGEKLAVFTVIFLVMMNYPILAIANKKGFIFSFPALYVYIFAIWFGFIVLLAVFIYVERRNYYKDEK
jgi:apolipoprotein N-acyltransferase